MRPVDLSAPRNDRVARSATLPALAVLCPSVLLLGASLALLGASGSFPLELLGVALLGINLVQWFVVMHECGHGTLFPSRAVNSALGHFAGFLTAFPFHAWRAVHHQHHVWTGWKDKDPTTARALPRSLPRWQRIVVDACWRWNVPLFMIIYRLDNFWNVGRLAALFRDAPFARGVAINVAVLVGLYVALALLLPARTTLLVAAASLLFNVLIEPVMLSQHSHISQRISGPGQSPEPFAPREQGVFTRSAHFPRAISRFVLFHFDRHEAHHAVPSAPCYLLPGIEVPSGNGMPFLTWWRESKRLRGHELLFKTRDETGAPV